MKRLPSPFVLPLVLLTATGLAQGENTALNAVIVDRSGDFNGDFTSEKAFDGAVRDAHSSNVGGPATSYWLSSDGQGTTAYFVADLGSSQAVAEIVLRPTSNSRFDDRGTLDFQIRGSNVLAEITGTTPTAPVILSGTLPDVTGAATSLLIHPTVPFNADNGLTVGDYQYLRFESLTAINNNAGLGEMMVRSTRDNLAFGKTIIDGSGAWNNTATGEAFDANLYPAASVTDGSASDRGVGASETDFWLGRETTDNEWFILDLGAEETIQRIDLINTHNRDYNDRGTDAFNIQGSTDGVTFSPLANGNMTSAAGAGGALPVDAFAVSGTARYLRFEAETYVAGGRGSGLAEIRVYKDFAGDTDLDGMLDTWELANFQTLARDGTEDEDLDDNMLSAPDGLTNKEEHDWDTDPRDPDSDDDTLTDGAEVKIHGSNPHLVDTDDDDLDDPDEVNVHGTDPSNRDTDLDSLTDGAEVSTHGTLPLVLDSDLDGWSDPVEIAEGTGARDPASAPFLMTTWGPLTGADPGEGLDFSGEFIYAINAGSNGSPGTIGDADFVQSSLATGVTVTYENDSPAWNPAVSYGDAESDTRLETVMQSIVWSAVDSVDPDAVTVEFASLVPGAHYKLQLLFDEACCPDRGFDVSVEGVLVADEFSPGVTQGEPRVNTGAVLTHDFIAGDDTLTVLLDGTTITSPGFTDRNAILQGATLELVGSGSVFQITSVSRTPGANIVRFNGRSGLRHIVDYSTDARIWREADDNVTGAGANTTYTDTDAVRVAEETLLYRVKEASQP